MQFCWWNLMASYAQNSVHRCICTLCQWVGEIDHRSLYSVHPWHVLKMLKMTCRLDKISEFTQTKMLLKIEKDIIWLIAVQMSKNEFVEQSSIYSLIPCHIEAHNYSVFQGFKQLKPGKSSANITFGHFWPLLNSQNQVKLVLISDTHGFRTNIVRPVNAVKKQTLKYKEKIGMKFLRKVLKVRKIQIYISAF